MDPITKATGSAPGRRAPSARLAAFGTCTALLLTACGNDDTGAVDAARSTTPPTTAQDGGDAPGTSDDEYCALAQEVFDQRDFPSATQLTRYQSLAPEAIQDAVTVAAPPLIEADSRPVEFWIAFGDDAVEEAIFAIDEFEAETCGVDHDDNPDPVLDEQPEEGAHVVRVAARDYAFEIEGDVGAGRTSFVLANDGATAHFLVLQRILQGTLEEALAFEGDPEAEGLVEVLGFSGVAAPGGDLEVVTADLETGDYALVCFVPDASFTPHAQLGMTLPFSVA